jgi:uncharacterized protein (TIRG00374 family)
VSPKRWGKAAAGLAVAALFVFLLARRVDWHEVRRLLAGAAWVPLGIAVGALALDMSARIVRWWWMLRAAEPGISLASCVRPFLGSLALNNTVPLRAGDVVRIFGFRTALRVPVAHVAGTLVLERMLDLLVLLAILFAGVLGTVGVFPRGFMSVAAAAGLATLAVLVILTLWPARISSLTETTLSRVFAGRTWLPTLSRVIRELTEALALLRSPGLAARLLGLSVLAWILEGAVFACVVWSLHLSVSWWAPWFALGAGTLATLLPSSPGYIGTFDYFASLALTAYGAPAAGATAFALLTHLVLWLPVTVVGLFVLFVGRPASTRAGVTRPLQADPGIPA